MDDIDADGVATRDMPGFHERISRAEMDAVLTYIRTLPVAAPPEEE
jgi:mono/diheme cytochrome c family protein